MEAFIWSDLILSSHLKSLACVQHLFFFILKNYYFMYYIIIKSNYLCHTNLSHIINNVISNTVLNTYLKLNRYWLVIYIVKVCQNGSSRDVCALGCCQSAITLHKQLMLNLMIFFIYTSSRS